MVVDNLDTLEQLSLKITNRHFHRLVTKPKQEQLIALELTQFAVDKRLLSCAACQRLRHEDKFKFPGEELDGPPYIGRFVHLTTKDTRICRDCHSLHDVRAGVPFDLRGKQLLMCRFCHYIKTMDGTECMDANGAWHCRYACQEHHEMQEGIGHWTLD